MKKQVIAVMLSIMMAAGSIGGMPVLAAEEAATAGIRTISPANTYLAPRATIS